MTTTVLTIFGVTGLLALIGLLQPVADRLRLPFSVVLAGVGSLLGGALYLAGSHDGGVAGDLANALSQMRFSSEVLLFVFLPTLLFETALSLDVRRLVDDAAAVLLLAVVAVIVATFAVGGALAWVSEWSLVVCLLLGAVVSTTDPVAVVAIFRDIGAPRRLCLLVEGESLFNDAVAIALAAILTGMLAGTREASVVEGTSAIVLGFAGGVLVGWAGARVVIWLSPVLRRYPLAEVTLTVAMAYLVYIIAVVQLEVSGVVAVVVAALEIGRAGRARMTPEAWNNLQAVWQQVAYWANSMVFLLASMVLPPLLIDMTWVQLGQAGVLVVAALVARAVVLYGMLPMLSRLGLITRVGGGYKTVILWGGLRGAVTLALALAVIENPGIPDDASQFIAVLATAFVLFTLTVQALTLRPLIQVLGLDRLPATEAAVRNRAMAVSMARLVDQIAELARRYRIDTDTAQEVEQTYVDRLRAVEGALNDCDLGAAQRVQIALVTLAQREEEIYRHYHDAGMVSPRILTGLVAQAGRILDRTRMEGVRGYLRATRHGMSFRWPFRAARWVQERWHVTRPVAGMLAERYEALVIMRTVLDDLHVFNRQRIRPLMGAATAQAVAGVLWRRIQESDAALEALRLQYPDYAAALSRDYLTRAALNLEQAEYREMTRESMISQEVANDLLREQDRRWRALDRRPSLDLELDRFELIRRMPLFQGLVAARVREIALLLTPRLTVPGEKIVRKGETGTAMYFIADGALEVRLKPTPVRLGSGDFFGELALITRQPRRADVVSISYCHLLVLDERDFRRLMHANEDLRSHIRAVARERLAQQIED